MVDTVAKRQSKNVIDKRGLDLPAWKQWLQQNQSAEDFIDFDRDIIGQLWKNYNRSRRRMPRNTRGPLQRYGKGSLADLGRATTKGLEEMHHEGLKREELRRTLQRLTDDPEPYSEEWLGM